MRSTALAAVAVLAVLSAAAPARAAGPCGEMVSIAAHDGATMRYSLAQPAGPAAGATPVALVLLAGGGGHLDLDDRGCARKLGGNSLVRSAKLFGAAGFVTALVDAPSDHTGEDGLGGFRLAAAHAEDLGKVVADLRRRTGGAVWLAGTSRGTISAVNAAARLAGPAAPDGIVLTSALMVGTPGGRKAWVADTVFDVALEDIKVPVLVVGHASDRCLRSPPGSAADIARRTNGAREQVAIVAGGPGAAMDLPWGVEACIGRAPHGFVGQEAEVAAGIARFIRGGAY